MQRPPAGVKLVMEALCIMKGVKPKKIPGEKPGTKVDDYWEPSKGLLQDPAKFLDGLFKYDKVKLRWTVEAGISFCTGMNRGNPHPPPPPPLQDNIPDNVISAIQPYMANEEFQPASIAKVSKACTSICQWVRAMNTYHFVAKGVEPKRVRVNKLTQVILMVRLPET